MVNVTIFVEGGVLPNENLAVQTVNNSEKLRESFHALFSQITDTENINLVIEIGAGEKQAVKFLKSQYARNDKQLLLIDLDSRPIAGAKEAKLKEFELENYSDVVIFMVQKMEAWILSQPEKLDEYLSSRYQREKPDRKLADDNNLLNKHPEQIIHPDKVLNTILARYFSFIKRDEKKKKKYGKLKDAPSFIAILDTNELKSTFSDFEKLYNLLNQ